MTDREKRVRLKIRTAHAEAKAGLGRLRDALRAGESTGPIRAEIDAFLLRAAQAEDELAEIAAAAGRVRDQRLWTLAGAIAAEPAGKINAKVARLRPAANTNPGETK